jgi:single-strand DNA-binding protein
MANDLNQCNFIGRLGEDPQVRYMPDGSAVANMTIACGWKSKDKEGAEWVKLVVYQKLAEICGEYLRKGSKVFVSGKFKTRKWTDQQGVERYTTEIVVNEMQMLDGKQDGAAPEQQKQQQRPAQQQQRPTQATQQRGPAQNYQPQMGNNPQGRFGPDQFDDEINF